MEMVLLILAILLDVFYTMHLQEVITQQEKRILDIEIILAQKIDEV